MARLVLLSAVVTILLVILAVGRQTVHVRSRYGPGMGLLDPASFPVASNIITTTMF